MKKGQKDQMFQKFEVLNTERSNCYGFTQRYGQKKILVKIAIKLYYLQ